MDREEIDERMAENIWSRVLQPTSFEVWRQSESPARDLVWSLIWWPVSVQTRTAVEHNIWDQIRDDAGEQQAEE